MKKRFSPGQEVVCIDKEMRPATEAAKNAPNLIFNNLYTIIHYEEFKHGHWWVRVANTPFGSFYTEDTFAPVTQINELIEEVNFVSNEIEFLWKILITK